MAVRDQRKFEIPLLNSFILRVKVFISIFDFLQTRSKRLKPKIENGNRKNKNRIEPYVYFAPELENNISYALLLSRYIV